MTVQPFVVAGEFRENLYVVHDDGEAALVDPGAATPSERQAVLDYVEAAGLRVRHLLLTHAHLDHILGCRFFAGRYGAAAEHGGWQLHPADDDLLAHAALQGELFGVRVDEPPPAAHALADGEEIALGRGRLRVLHLPGHSPGSVGFYNEAEGWLLGGDVLFADGIGRTDLWGGSLPQLLRSIRERLLVLPDETIVYPGHGPRTTVGRERRANPYLNPG